MSDDHEDMAYQGRQVVTTVYDELGPGFYEETYRTAVEMELKDRKIPYERQKVIDVKFKGKVIDQYKLDFVLFGKILLRVLAEGEYHPKYKAQVVSQLKAARYKIGLLIDFGMQKLQVHKILNPDFYFGATPPSDEPATKPSRKDSDLDERRGKFDNLFND